MVFFSYSFICGRLWSSCKGCFKPKIEEPLKTERNSGQFRFIEKMAHERFIEQPNQKPAGVLSARRGVWSECGSTEQPTVGEMSEANEGCRRSLGGHLRCSSLPTAEKTFLNS